MYLVFAIIAALIGATFSVVMRLELLQPGVQYFNGPTARPTAICGTPWSRRTA